MIFKLRYILTRQTWHVKGDWHCSSTFLSDYRLLFTHHETSDTDCSVKGSTPRWTFPWAMWLPQEDHTQERGDSAAGVKGRKAKCLCFVWLYEQATNGNKGKGWFGNNTGRWGTFRKIRRRGVPAPLADQGSGPVAIPLIVFCKLLSPPILHI